MAVPPPTPAECELASSTAENPFPGECGRFDASLLRQQRIAGGRAVPRGLVPWQAQIRICGATIIDELHLLTAATCTTYPRNLIGTKVYAGHIVTDGISMAEDAECTRQERTIESVSVHPCHCPSRDTLCGSASSPGVGSMIKAYQYDIVCNGIELSSGAIRNHIPELMYKLFAIAGYDKKSVEENVRNE